MKAGNWILYERTNQWAAALRMALLRESPRQPAPRIYEVRRLDDLSSRLNAQPASLVLIEVVPTNLSAVLAWLPIATQCYSTTLFAALLDREISGAPIVRRDASDALREAGASEIAPSPRQIDGLLALAERHAAIDRASYLRADPPSLTEWAWSLLPWQDA
jgi:hypothetical protein